MSSGGFYRCEFATSFADAQMNMQKLPLKSERLCLQVFPLFDKSSFQRLDLFNVEVSPDEVLAGTEIPGDREREGVSGGRVKVVVVVSVMLVVSVMVVSVALVTSALSLCLCLSLSLCLCLLSLIHI